MSTSTISTIDSRALEALRSTSTKAVDVFRNTQGGAVDIVSSLQVAETIADLRTLFDTPAIKSRIVSLQDTPLGFRTDSDPKVWNKKKNAYNEPYKWEVVRDCVIEATLRGLQLVGNHFNIMAGRCYVTKEGFEFLIKRVPGLTRFAPTLGIPQTKTNGCIIECTAKWSLNGVDDSCSASIPVKMDDYSGVDQLLGKATRKFLKRCYEQMTGVSVPEGEDDTPTETPEIESTARRPRIARQPENVIATVPPTAPLVAAQPVVVAQPVAPPIPEPQAAPVAQTPLVVMPDPEVEPEPQNEVSESEVVRPEVEAMVKFLEANGATEDVLIEVIKETPAWTPFLDGGKTKINQIKSVDLERMLSKPKILGQLISLVLKRIFEQQAAQ